MPAPSSDLLAFLEAYDPGITQLVLALRQMVLTEAPGVTELVYDAYEAVAIAYTFTGSFRTGICHIAAYTKHVNLGFNQGTHLPDPDRLLKGTGKSIRHISIKSAADLNHPGLRHFLRLAMAASNAPEQAPQATRTLTKSVSPVKRRPPRK